MQTLVTTKVCAWEVNTHLFLSVFFFLGGVEGEWSWGGGVMLMLSVPWLFSSYIPLSETLMSDISVELHGIIGL